MALVEPSRGSAVIWLGSFHGWEGVGRARGAPVGLSGPSSPSKRDGRNPLSIGILRIYTSPDDDGVARPSLIFLSARDSVHTRAAASPRLLPGAPDALSPPPLSRERATPINT